MGPHQDRTTTSESLQLDVLALQDAARVAEMEHISTPVDDLLAEVRKRMQELGIEREAA